MTWAGLCAWPNRPNAYDKRRLITPKECVGRLAPVSSVQFSSRTVSEAVTVYLSGIWSSRTALDLENTSWTKISGLGLGLEGVVLEHRYPCRLFVCRETVRTVSWRATSSWRSTRVSSRKATPTSSASTCSGRSTRTTAARSTSRSSCKRSTSRRPVNRNRSSSGHSTCTTSTATGPSNPARCPKLSAYVHL